MAKKRKAQRKPQPRKPAPKPTRKPTPKTGTTVAPSPKTGEGAAPPWLSVMRTMLGTKEAPGSADNPVILGMRDEIIRIWEDVDGLEAYANTYQHDETPWCGLAAGYAVSEAGFMPPFKRGSDTDSWYWAQAWASDPNYVELSQPVLGAITVLTRDGGGHVSLYERTEGSNVILTGGNQSDAVTTAPFAKSTVIGYFWPADAPQPDIPRGTVQKGSKGPDVVAVQEALGVYPADGDFGSITDGAVRGYQAACSIAVDGVVGPNTWAKIDELTAKVDKGSDGLSDELVGAIMDVAENSAIADYNWRDRGMAPLGYTTGVALCFALTLDRLNAEDDAAWEMAKGEIGNTDKDALAWYADEFRALGMANDEDGVDTLRHLFALMLGLGLRESSGRYCEGRDQSASNTSADEAEAGMYQTSWNIRSCDSTIPPLLTQYWANPCGFRAQFQDGVTLKSSDLGNYGSGDGAKYQFLSKYAPAFHALVTGVGLRNLRQHWGPINRKEVELKMEADVMLKAVQTLVEQGVEPEPEPEPPDYENRVDIMGTVDEVVITGDVYVTVNGQPWEGT